MTSPDQSGARQIKPRIRRRHLHDSTEMRSIDLALYGVVARTGDPDPSREVIELLILPNQMSITPGFQNLHGHFAP
jgi:hypothetical protein